MSLFPPAKPFSPEQKEQIAQIVQGASSDRARVARLHDWVRSHVRYIADERGVHGLVPRDPAVVMDRLYGDCKDMVFLVAGMARELGIRVDPVLVGVAANPPFSGVHRGTFNHVIASYVHQGERLFFDPTCTHCPFVTLPETDVEKTGLVLVSDNPKKITIARPPQKPSVEVDLFVSAKKPLEARAEVVLRNGMFRKALVAKKKKNQADLEVHLSQLIGNTFLGILFEDSQWGEQKQGAIHLKARADLYDFFVRTSKTILVPKVPFATRAKSILVFPPKSGFLSTPFFPGIRGGRLIRATKRGLPDSSPCRGTAQRPAS